MNPPGNQKARYQINESTPADPEDWLKTAETEQGSWWTDLLAWLGERCGTDTGPGRTRRRRTAADRRRAGHVRLGHLTGVQRAGRGHREPGHRRRGAVPAPGRPHPAAPLAGHLPRAADPGRDPPRLRTVLADSGYVSSGELRPRRPGQAAAARAAGQRPRPDGRAGALPRGPGIWTSIRPPPAPSGACGIPRGREDYKLRARTVEPVFGQLKTCQKISVMSRRGLAAREGEWLLACTAHNLRKLHRHRLQGQRSTACRPAAKSQGRPRPRPRTRICIPGFSTCA